MRDFRRKARVVNTPTIRITYHGYTKNFKTAEVAAKHWAISSMHTWASANLKPTWDSHDWHLYDVRYAKLYRRILKVFQEWIKK